MRGVPRARPPRAADAGAIEAAVAALKAERRWAVSGGVKGKVEPAALLNLIGCRTARGGGWRGEAGTLVREARGELATLTARGVQDPGGFGAAQLVAADENEDWEL